MSSPSDASGVRSIYDLWLGLVPMMFPGAGTGASARAAEAAPGIGFPGDQVARAAAMTQEALDGIARVYAPVLQASGPDGLLAQWATALSSLMGAAQTMMPAGATATPPSAAPLAQWASMMPWLAGAKPAPAAADPLGMIGPWAAMMPFMAPAAGAQAGGPAAAMAALGNATTMAPLQAMQQSWTDFAKQWPGMNVQTMRTGFDRTFGALGDALGLGPARKLQAAFGDIVEATVAQNDARMTYLMLVQGAMVTGFEGLLQRLARMADAGERVDSFLVLLKMWAGATEEAVHGVLQSEPGLAATAAVSRAGITHRRKTQHVAAILADMLDMATRRDVDEAYREIQSLKREVRALRAAVQGAAAGASAAGASARGGPRKPSRRSAVQAKTRPSNTP